MTQHRFAADPKVLALNAVVAVVGVCTTVEGRLALLVRAARPAKWAVPGYEPWITPNHPHERSTLQHRGPVYGPMRTRVCSPRPLTSAARAALARLELGEEEVRQVEVGQMIDLVLHLIPIARDGIGRVHDAGVAHEQVDLGPVAIWSPVGTSLGPRLQGSEAGRKAFEGFQKLSEEYMM